MPRRIQREVYIITNSLFYNSKTTKLKLEGDIDTQYIVYCLNEKSTYLILHNDLGLAPWEMNRNRPFVQQAKNMIVVRYEYYKQSRLENLHFDIGRMLLFESTMRDFGEEFMVIYKNNKFEKV